MGLLSSCLFPLLLGPLMAEGSPGAPAGAGLAVSGSPSPAALAHAFAKALSWVQGHPAAEEEAASLEVGEEVYMFYILHNTARDKRLRAQYREQVSARQPAMRAAMAADEASGRYLFDPWSPISYTVMASMLGELGLRTTDYRRTIDAMRLFHRNFWSEDPSVRLMLGLYLERLGLQSPSPVPRLIEQSRVYREPRTREVMRQLRGRSLEVSGAGDIQRALYNLTHEILGLTDFGRLPAPEFVCRQWEAYRQTLDAGMDWAIAHRRLDVLAELVVCSKLLGLGAGPTLGRAIGTLLESQQQDGSFGAAMANRPNPYRHPALTGATALRVSLCDNVCGSPCRR
jgi:hypothetical protein